MSGYSSLRSAVIWLQGHVAGKAQIEFWDAALPEAVMRSKPQMLDADEDYTAKIAMDDLEPGRTYGYRVLLDGQRAEGTGPLQFRTQDLWQWRRDPPDFTMLAGSCLFINEAAHDRPGKAYGGGFEIFAAMAAKKADLMLWLGDNLYFREVDYASPGGMAYRYRHDRALPELQSLLRTGNHYAIWDDHDYGPDDANSSFVFKDQSLRLFKRYWANPAYGLPELPGIFTTASFNDADLFLLDGRSYRDSDRGPDFPGKSMFGARQIAWLKNALMASTANFKVIVSGSQALNDGGVYEGWHQFPQERKEFLDWLTLAKMDGVLFLTGDAHRTELMRIERPGTYPLYDLTCSPLTAGTHSIKALRTRPNLVPGTLVGKRNFCSLAFSGAKDVRKITLRSFDPRGTMLWERDIPLAEIRNPRN